MKLGIGCFPTDDSVDPGWLAREVEERGFDSLFFSEHTHIPVDRTSPYPDGGEMPSEYWHCLDPFVALTAAAAATDRLLLGTGILLVAQRDPIITAKQTASLDWLSGGRFLFGIGGGWNLEEMRNHGTDPTRRFGLMGERVEAIRAIWTEDEAAYHGRFVDFDPIWSWPKPVQKPHPPILVGGNGRQVLDRVRRYGDEWLPNASVGEGIHDKIRRRIIRIREEGIPTTIAAAPRDLAELDAYREAGTHRAVWWIPPGDEGATAAQLDELATLAARLEGAG